MSIACVFRISPMSEPRHPPAMEGGEERVGAGSWVPTRIVSHPVGLEQIEIGIVAIWS
jgi:hypothetical protein